MLQRKTPLTRKKPLRAKAPLKAKSSFRTKTLRQAAAPEDDAAARKLAPLLAARGGPPFTEQERIGPWHADFACVAAKLVILFAGDDDPARHDWFAAQSWRVLSFDAGAVAREPQAVLDAVAAAFTLRIVGR